MRRQRIRSFRSFGPLPPTVSRIDERELELSLHDGRYMSHKRTRAFFKKRVLKSILKAILIACIIAGFAWLSPIMFSTTRGGPFY